MPPCGHVQSTLSHSDKSHKIRKPYRSQNVRTNSRHLRRTAIQQHRKSHRSDMPHHNLARLQRRHGPLPRLNRDAPEWLCEFKSTLVPAEQNDAQ